MSSATDSDTAIAPMPPRESARGYILAVCLFNGALLSFCLCLVCMRTAVGTVDMPGASFGISKANLQVVNIAAMLSALPMMLVTGTVFLLLKPRRKWWTLVPAIGIPLFGAAVFAVFLLSCLAT